MVDRPMEPLRMELERIAFRAGAKAFGVADLDGLRRSHPRPLDAVAEDCSRALVCGIRLQRAVLDRLQDRPTPLYMHHYRQVNYQLDTLALEIADRLQDAGYQAIPVPASQIISRDPMAGWVSHRLLGWAAGLGYRGRNNLLVHPHFGAHMRYVSVLTDAPFPPGRPLEQDCGSCRACIEVCPVSAIRDTPEEFDRSACTAKLTEFARLPFIGQHICGLCVRVCAGRECRSPGQD